jgi:hypothetical protein
MSNNRRHSWVSATVASYYAFIHDTLMFYQLLYLCASDNAVLGLMNIAVHWPSVNHVVSNHPMIYVSNCRWASAYRRTLNKHLSVQRIRFRMQLHCRPKFNIPFSRWWLVWPRKLLLRHYLLANYWSIKSLSRSKLFSSFHLSMSVDEIDSWLFCFFVFPSCFLACSLG